MNKIQINKFKVVPLYNTVSWADISDEEYFSSKYSNYISNSKLKLIDETDGGGPESYQQGFKSSFNPSFQIGTAVHELCLQSDKFKLYEKCGKPSAKLGYCLDFICKYRKQGLSVSESIDKARQDAEYYVNLPLEKVAQKINTPECIKYYQTIKDLPDNYILLSDSDWEIVTNCLNSLKSNTSIQSRLHPIDDFGLDLPSFNEQAFFMDFKIIYDDKSIVLPFKMKADNWTVDVDKKLLTLNDLKTTRHICKDFMETSWEQYKYYRQMFIYSLILTAFCRKKYNYDDAWSLKANMLVVQTNDTFYSSLFHVPEKELVRGKRDFIRLISRVAYYEIFGWDKEVNFID